jgi:DNA-binding NarL/FixJ family response regulator
VTVFANYAALPFRFREETVTQLPASLADNKGLSLRDAAQAVDARASIELSLPLLWRELTRGLCKIVDGFFTPSRCLLVTSPTQKAVPLEGRRLHVVEAILSGVGQKSIAIELGLAPSTVALNARLALEALGTHTRPSRVNPLLMLSALASRAQHPGATGALSYLNDEQASLRVISIPRPDAPLEATLPRAELAVIRSLVEGVSYAEIALRRGTSTRTIANQITAVFRRMKVSGRSELLLRLFHASPLFGTLSCAAVTVAPPKTNVLEVIAG